ncbi:MAG TPA: hypothetical protein VFP05_12715 [Thermomicrobiales bacterium]|nr:hypothetical protein [Thermomicrobiales bacterium]
MTLISTFAELDRASTQLDQVYGNFLWAVVQAKPESGDGSAMVDHWEDAAQDTAGLAREICVAAREGRPMANARFDPVAAQQALLICQQRFDPLWLRHCADLMAFERRQALWSMSRKGGAWAQWAEGVVDALDRCLPALYELSCAISHSWEELVDRQGLVSVSVRTSVTGQDFRNSGNGMPLVEERIDMASGNGASRGAGA